VTTTSRATKPARRSILGALLLGIAVCACQRPQPAAFASMDDGERRAPTTGLAGPSAHAFAYVTLGVEDLDRALGLWSERFGMEVSRRSEDPDPALAALRGYAPDAIVGQALLNAPGLIDGGIHLVRFARSDQGTHASRRSAEGPAFGIAVAVRDLERYLEALSAGGLTPARDLGILEPGGRKLRAARLPAADGVEVLIVETPGAAVVTRERIDAVYWLLIETDELEREAGFFTEVLGLERLESGSFPIGTGERLRSAPMLVLGDSESHLGRIALVEASALAEDAPRSAAASTRGILGVTYVVPDLAPILARGARFGVREHGRVSSLLGEGRMASVHSPSGLRIDIIEQ